MTEQSKTRIGPLKTVGNVASELARIYRLMRREEIEGAQGERLARVLTMLRQAVEVGEVERRLEELEQRK